MPEDVKEADKPWYTSRSVWSGLAMVVVSVLAGVLGKVDPIEAGALAIAGLSVVFLRASVATAIGLAYEVLSEIRKAKKGAALFLAFALPILLSGCHRDLTGTLDRVGMFLEKVRDDYRNPETHFSEDPEWDVKFREARVKALEAHLDLIEEAKKG